MNLKDKALVVIEHIALHSDWLTVEEYQKNIDVIYMASHVANGHCTADHKSWVDDVEKAYTDLVERGEYKDVIHGTRDEDK